MVSQDGLITKHHRGIMKDILTVSSFIVVIVILIIPLCSLIFRVIGWYIYHIESILDGIGSYFKRYYCRGCEDCTYCKKCINCVGCVYCIDCNNCINCNDIYNCNNCTSCTDCVKCIKCKDCINCNGLTGKTGWVNNKAPIGVL